MKLALQLGYWGAGPTDATALVAEAERSGFDAVFTAESWGSDAFTPLAWWGSRTSRIRLGTSIVQLSARTPAATAMAALTLDHLSGGRAVLGLGVSGPQVVEGWYGQPFAKPLARTREYISIIRQVLAREAPVANDGPHYPLPYDGPGSVGLGKALKPITHPLRAELPILLGAEGPKNVALAAEIADGWLPIFFAPKAAELYWSWLNEGFARPGARRTPDDFEIAATCHVTVTDDPEPAIATLKSYLALYIGGMGATDMNFHKNVFERTGYGREAAEVQRLFLAGEREQAVAAIPDALVDDVALIGPKERVRDRLKEWADAGVTTLIVGCRTPEEVRATAEAVLD